MGAKKSISSIGDTDTDTVNITKDILFTAMELRVNEDGLVNRVEVPAITKVHMLKEIKFCSAFGIMVGAIIGSGIFISPVAIVRNCQSVGLSLTVWLICGVLTMTKALCSLELGLLYPKAGGEYQYIKAINGNFVAFLQAWSQWVYVEPCSQAIMSQTAIIYLLESFLPADCSVSPFSLKLLSGWLTISMVILNCLHIRYTTNVQNVLTAMKIMALVVIIVGGLVHIFRGNTENFASPFKDSTTSASNIGVAIYSGMFSYSGWHHIFNLIEEVKKPEKVVQRSLVSALVCVIVLYILANVAYFSALTPLEIANSPAVAMSFSEKTLGVVAKIIPICVACSAIGSLNGALLGGSRTIFAPARDGLLPKEAAMISIRFLTPWTSLWSVCLISLVYTFMFTVDALIEYQTFLVLITSTTILGDLLYLRVVKPALHRPYKVTVCWPVMLLTANVALVVLGMITDPKGKLLSLAVIFSGIPIYWMFITNDVMPYSVKAYMNWLSRSLQKLLMVVPEET